MTKELKLALTLSAGIHAGILIGIPVTNPVEFDVERGPTSVEIFVLAQPEPPTPETASVPSPKPPETCCVSNSGGVPSPYPLPEGEEKKSFPRQRGPHADNIILEVNTK